MNRSPTEIVAAILDNPKDIANVRSLCAADVTYVSLNYEDNELKRIMPWCGTSHGAEAIVQTFVDVGRYWKVDVNKIDLDRVAVYQEPSGDSAPAKRGPGEAAVFDQTDYRSPHVDVDPQLGQSKVTSSMNGRCGSTSVTSRPAKDESSVREPTAVSWAFAQRQIGSGVPQ